MALAAGLGGCAARPIARSEILAAIADHGLGIDAIEVGAEPVVIDTETPESPAGSDDLTCPLERLLAAADRDNPAIIASRSTARALAERVIIVTALPDPLLTTKTLPEPVRTAEGDNHFVLNVVQRIPAPEKLDRLGRIALQELRMAINAMTETRQRVRGDVKRSAYRLFLIRKTTEILIADRDLLRTLIETARAQLRAGKRSQGDVLRGEVAIATLDAKLLDLAANDVAILASLNALLNRDPMSAINELVEPDSTGASFDVAEMLARALENNPTLARMVDQVERERQALALAKLASVPDFNIGFEWMAMEGRGAFVPPVNSSGVRPRTPQLSEAGSDNWGIIFGMTLPIWVDRNASLVTLAQRQLEASQQSRLSAQRAVERDFLDALRRHEAQQERASLFREAIIPQAEQTYQVSLAEYRGAKADFDAVIEDHRNWLALTIRYYEILTAMGVAFADLEVATGLSLVVP